MCRDYVVTNEFVDVYLNLKWCEVCCEERCFTF